MPLYTYTALNEKGRKIHGSITAANEIDLEERLKGIGMDLVACKEARERAFSFFGSVTLNDLIILCIHLEQLERAGVPILDAIADLRDSADSPKLKNLMAEIYESVKGGELLSSALAKHPKIFGTVFTGLIATGEKTGQLSEVFAHLAKHLKWVSEIRRKIKKATYYPTFLLILMMGIVSLMMLLVIPKLSGFLLAQNIELPFYTKALIVTSDAFANYWYIFIIGPFAAFFGIKAMLRASEDMAFKWDELKLIIPIVGITIRKIELARFCHFFAITFRSGIGVLECLDIANNVVENRVIKDSINTARKGVSEGNSLTASLRLTNQFPSLVLRMFRVGEESGNLDGTLENINFFYDREVDDAVNNMVGFVQPALTIILGGLMFWISLAVFGPLYGSFSKMKF